MATAAIAPPSLSPRAHTLSHSLPPPRSRRALPAGGIRSARAPLPCCPPRPPPSLRLPPARAERSPRRGGRAGKACVGKAAGTYPERAGEQP